MMLPPHGIPRVLAGHVVPLALLVLLAATGPSLDAALSPLSTLLLLPTLLAYHRGLARPLIHRATAATIHGSDHDHAHEHVPFSPTVRIRNLLLAWPALALGHYFGYAGGFQTPNDNGQLVDSLHPAARLVLGLFAALPYMIALLSQHGPLCLPPGTFKLLPPRWTSRTPLALLSRMATRSRWLAFPATLTAANFLVTRYLSPFGTWGTLTDGISTSDVSTAILNLLGLHGLVFVTALFSTLLVSALAHTLLGGTHSNDSPAALDCAGYYLDGIHSASPYTLAATHDAFVSSPPMSDLDLHASGTAPPPPPPLGRLLSRRISSSMYAESGIPSVPATPLRPPTATTGNSSTNATTGGMSRPTTGDAKMLGMPVHSCRPCAGYSVLAAGVAPRKHHPRWVHPRPWNKQCDSTASHASTHTRYVGHSVTASTHLPSTSPPARDLWKATQVLANAASSARNATTNVLVHAHHVERRGNPSASEYERAALMEHALKVAKAHHVWLALAYWEPAGLPSLMPPPRLPPWVGKNKLTMVSPRGDVVLDYVKVHPVFDVEGDIQPGRAPSPPMVQVDGVKVAVAICLDGDFDGWVHQVARTADVLIMPSWTWGSLGPTHRLHAQQVVYAQRMEGEGASPMVPIPVVKVATLNALVPDAIAWLCVPGGGPGEAHARGTSGNVDGANEEEPLLRHVTVVDHGFGAMAIRRDAAVALPVRLFCVMGDDVENNADIGESMQGGHQQPARIP
ncbi:hypothetical protein BCR44DRAFT_1424102 [Catenaria anguillulae PL171]|uniref:Carbon-nitrogen hydrolase n=1 Tax=Catenaria anguillulae PL171 TaxID=765915 RepID=A0A1Y2I276_9FUNG|nr:hypothetical protein BCR44DRAFT_1424102 [Catenaria anguillulae PL171]